MPNDVLYAAVSLYISLLHMYVYYKTDTSSVFVSKYFCYAVHIEMLFRVES